MYILRMHVHILPGGVYTGIEDTSRLSTLGRNL